MLNQQHPLLNTIDSYIEPLLKRVLQTKRLGKFLMVILIVSHLHSIIKSSFFIVIVLYVLKEYVMV